MVHISHTDLLFAHYKGTARTRNETKGLSFTAYLLLIFPVSSFTRKHLFIDYTEKYLANFFRFYKIIEFFTFINLLSQSNIINAGRLRLSY